MDTLTFVRVAHHAEIVVRLNAVYYRGTVNSFGLYIPLDGA